MSEKKRTIRLVAMDLDGTLLNPEGKISEIDKQAVQEAAQAGIHMVISTGRPFVGISRTFAEAGVRYAITTNGAGVYRFPEKVCLLSDCMDKELVCEVMNRLRKLNVYFDVFTEEEPYSQESMLPMVDFFDMPAGNREYIKETRIRVPDIVDFIRKSDLQVQKITVNFMKQQDGSFTDRDKAEAILEEYPELDHLCGGFHDLEFTKAGVQKGNGLKYLADLFSIDLSETMAIGDTSNDINIMQTAGFGVVMANGTEDVKAVADAVTLSNGEGGVAHAIRKYVLHQL